MFRGDDMGPLVAIVLVACAILAACCHRATGGWLGFRRVSPITSARAAAEFHRVPSDILSDGRAGRPKASRGVGSEWERRCRDRRIDILSEGLPRRHRRAVDDLLRRARRAPRPEPSWMDMVAGESVECASRGRTADAVEGVLMIAEAYASGAHPDISPNWKASRRLLAAVVSSRFAGPVQVAVASSRLVDGPAEGAPGSRPMNGRHVRTCLDALRALERTRNRNPGETTVPEDLWGNPNPGGPNVLRERRRHGDPIETVPATRRPVRDPAAGSQNVHDPVVSGGLRGSLDAMVRGRGGELPGPEGCERARAEMVAAALEAVGTPFRWDPAAVIAGIESMDSARHGYLGATPEQAATIAWERIGSVQDPEERRNVTETFLAQMAGAIEAGGPVCVQGRIARALGSLDGTSAGVAAPLRDTRALATEIAGLAAVIREDVLERMGPETRAEYEAGGAPEAISQMRDRLSREASETYADLPGVSTSVLEAVLSPISEAF